MNLFILTAIAAYLLTVRPRQHQANNIGFDWQFWIELFKFCIGFILAGVIMVWLLVFGSPYLLWWTYLSGEKSIADILLGGAFGAWTRASMRHWRWVASEDRKLTAIGTAGVLASLLLIDVFMIHSEMTGRFVGVETPFLKFQLAERPNERNFKLNAERDLMSLFQIDSVMHSAHIIDYECGYANLTQLKDDSKQKFSPANFESGIRFRDPKVTALAGFAATIQNTFRAGYSRESLQARTVPVAQAYYQLLMRIMNEHRSKNPPKAASSGAQRAAWIKEENPSTARRIEFSEETLSCIGACVDSHLQAYTVFPEIDFYQAEIIANKAAEELIDSKISWLPNYSDPPNSYLCVNSKNLDKPLKGDEFKALVLETRYAHGLVAALLLFSGNASAALKLMEEAQRVLPSGMSRINLTRTIGEMKYLAGDQDWGSIQSDFIRARDLIKREESEIQSRFPKNDKNANPLSDDYQKRADMAARLLDRYKRATWRTQRDLAYYFAQETFESLQKHADISPNLNRAGEYAREAFSAISKGEWPILKCYDDDEEVATYDILAFVILATEAQKSSRIGAAFDRVRIAEAKSLLTHAKESLLRENKDKVCFDKSYRNLWLQRVSGHLILAETMLN